MPTNCFCTNLWTGNISGLQENLPSDDAVLTLCLESLNVNLSKADTDCSHRIGTQTNATAMTGRIHSMQPSSATSSVAKVNSPGEAPFTLDAGASQEAEASDDGKEDDDDDDEGNDTSDMGLPGGVIMVKFATYHAKEPVFKSKKISKTITSETQIIKTLSMKTSQKLEQICVTRHAN